MAAKKKDDGNTGATGMEPSAPGTADTTPSNAPADTVAARTRDVKPKLYIVTDEAKKTEVPVKALTRARAISYVAEATFKARLATMDEVLAMGQKGVEVYDATTEE
jgi:hypothetical protein